MYWKPNLISARWAGADLVFDAATNAGIVRYIVRGSRLENAAQRTGREALESNLPRLKSLIIERSRLLQAGEVLTID